MKIIITLTLMSMLMLSGCQIALFRACGPEGSERECNARLEMIRTGTELMNQ